MNRPDKIPTITVPRSLTPAHKLDVATHDDIDWRDVSVAEAIDHDRAHYQAMRGRIDQARAAKAKPGKWAVLLQVLGIRPCV